MGRESPDRRGLKAGFIIRRRCLWQFHRALQRCGHAWGVSTLPVLGSLSRRLFTLGRDFLFTPPRAPEFVHVRGLTIHWPPHDTGQSVIDLLYDDYEPGTTRLFESLLEPGMTVVDVGAHVGYYTLLAARAVGEAGKVYAFEPHTANFGLLKENVARNGFRNVTCVAKAVSDREGEIELFLSEESSGQHSVFGAVGGSRVVTVEVTTLDSFFFGQGWPPVDLVKVDVEGAERAVFSGMRELAGRNPGMRLIWELNPGCQEGAGVYSEELFGILQGMGFDRFFLLRGSPALLQVPRDIKRLVHQGGGNILPQKSQREGPRLP